MDDVHVCEIPSNSDIAGIGVRASIYAQICLVLFNFAYTAYASSVPYIRHFRTEEDDIELGGAPTSQSQAQPPLVALKQDDTPPQQDTDRVVQPKQSPLDVLMHPPSLSDSQVAQRKEYISLSRSLQRSLFMIGFAIILSAILEAKSAVGLDPYHALIILNVSQINNWAGHVLLNFRNDAQPDPSDLTCIENLLEPWDFVTSLDFVLYTAHSMMMSGLGLYFWSSLTPFLGYADAAPQQPCQPITYFWVFGTVEVSNRSLRIASLVFYAITILPVIGYSLLNALSAVVGFLGMVLFALALSIESLLAGVLRFLLSPLARLAYRVQFIRSAFSALARRLAASSRNFKQSRWGHLSWLAYLLPVALLPCIPLVYLVVATELTIRANEAHLEPELEKQWTYGQTLALFSALVAIILYFGGLYRLERKRRAAREGTVGSVEPEAQERGGGLVAKGTQTEW